MNDKLKNGNSLETQFWSDDVDVDLNNPLIKLINEVWNKDEDYVPTKEEIDELNKKIEEYYKIKVKQTKKQ